MSPAPPLDRNPRGKGGSTPALFYTVLVLLVLGIIAFFFFRPGSGRTIPGNPASPARQQ